MGATLTFIQPLRYRGYPGPTVMAGLLTGGVSNKLQVLATVENLFDLDEDLRDKVHGERDRLARWLCIALATGIHTINGTVTLPEKEIDQIGSFLRGLSGGSDGRLGE